MFVVVFHLLKAVVVRVEWGEPDLDIIMASSIEWQGCNNNNGRGEQGEGVA